MNYLDQYTSLVLFSFSVWSIAAILGVRGATTPIGAAARKWSIKGLVLAGSLAGLLSFLLVVLIGAKVWQWPWWAIFPVAGAQAAGMSFAQFKVMESAGDIWFPAKKANHNAN
ncbi:MAG: hypothetical protein ACOY5C_12275 [Pseudomonadota bacterium]